MVPARHALFFPWLAPLVRLVRLETMRPQDGDAAQMVVAMAVNMKQRIWAKISPEPNSGCWLWTGGLGSNLGYGKFNHKQAHRAAYEAFRGPIPPGLTIDHLCRTPSCVNPDHLEPVTHRENILRGRSLFAMNAKKTHCPRGHPLFGDNVYIRIDHRGRECKSCRAAAERARQKRLRNL